MSKHHHHPDEGHAPGTPLASRTPRHGFFFYIAGFFILIALLCFIVNGASWWPTVPAPVTSTSAK